MPSNLSTYLQRTAFLVTNLAQLPKRRLSGNSYHFVDNASHRQRAGVIKVAAG